jgi:hypothetical protein
MSVIVPLRREAEIPGVPDENPEFVHVITGVGVPEIVRYKVRVVPTAVSLIVPEVGMVPV